MLRNIDIRHCGSDCQAITSFGFGQQQFAEITLKAEDIDGTENGEYTTKEVTLDTFGYTKIKEENGSWFNGGYELSGEITLPAK